MGKRWKIVQECMSAPLLCNMIVATWKDSIIAYLLNVYQSLHSSIYTYKRIVLCIKVYGRVVYVSFVK